MARFFPLLMLLFTTVGAVLGWNAVPHYNPPADSGEARLRERAAQYYQASRLFEFQSMAQLFTPAKQIAETQSLLEDSKNSRLAFSSFNEDNQTGLRHSADSITAESLEIELDGDWATTWGDCKYPTKNTEVTVPLQKMVWVKSAGDWWIYAWTKPEIAAYGNPPDESYVLLRERRVKESRREAQEMQQAAQQAAQEPKPDEESEEAPNSDKPTEVRNGATTD